MAGFSTDSDAETLRCSGACRKIPAIEAPAHYELRSEAVGEQRHPGNDASILLRMQASCWWNCDSRFVAQFSDGEPRATG